MPMWPWTRTPPAPNLTEVLERLERLEREMKNLSLDWDATYDKFSTLLKRWAKRERRLIEQGDGEQLALQRRDFITRGGGL